MSKLAIAAWVFVVGCIAAALVSVVAQPVHWERTLGLAVVVGIGAAVIAVQQSRGAKAA